MDSVEDKPFKNGLNISILLLLLEDLYQRKNIFLSEIKEILQTSKYFRRLSTDGSIDKSFFDNISNSALHAANDLSNNLHKDLRLEKLAYTFAFPLATIKKQIPEDVKNALFDLVFSEFNKIEKNKLKSSLEFLQSKWLFLLNNQSNNNEEMPNNTSMIYISHVLEEINKRFYYMKGFDEIAERIRLCRKSLSERMETLRPFYSSIPSRFYRKEVKKNIEIIDMIFEEYAKRINYFMNKFVYQKQYSNEFNYLLLCDHRNTTKVKFYPITQMDENNIVKSDVIVRAPLWLSELPRYIPVLAHEISHAVLDYVFEKADKNELELREDFKKMRTTIKNRIKVIHFFKKFKFIKGTSDELISTMINEVLADLISIIVAGPGYVFALFFSLIHDELISNLVKPTHLPSPFVRLKLAIYFLEISYQKSNVIKSWIKPINDLLIIYETYLSFYRSSSIDSVAYLVKNEYYDCIFKAFNDSIEEYLLSSRYYKVSEFSWTGDINIYQDKRKKIEDVYNKFDIPINNMHTTCFLCEEDNLSRSIPNILWSSLLSRYDSIVNDYDFILPEGRILRELYSVPINESYALGDCYEVLLYDLNWGLFIGKDKSVNLFKNALINGINSYCDEKRLKSCLNENSQKASCDPILIPMFGESDYFLIRDSYSSKSYYESWPPTPKAISFDNIEDSYHIKRYIYQELIFKSNAGKNKLIDKIRETINNYKYIIVTRIEFSEGENNRFLEYFGKEIDNNNLLASCKLLGILQSTAWENYTLLFEIDGIGNLIQLLKILVELKDNKLLLRSVTQLLYDYGEQELSKIPPNKHLSTKKENNELAKYNFKAITRITHPLNNQIKKEVLEKAISIIHKIDIARLHYSYGTSDMVIEWKLEHINDIRKIRDAINKLVMLGCVGDSSTSFVTDPL